MQSVRRTSVLTEQVDDLAERWDLEVIADYVGEGTGDEPCLAVVGSLESMVGFVRQAEDELELDDAMDDDAWNRVHQVTLPDGRTAYLWPDIYVQAAEEESEDDDEDLFDEDEED